MFEQNKVVGSICHGPSLLISAKVLRDRKVTCFCSIKDDVINAGATYTDEVVIRVFSCVLVCVCVCVFVCVCICVVGEFALPAFDAPFAPEECGTFLAFRSIGVCSVCVTLLLPCLNRGFLSCGSFLTVALV